MTYIGRATLLLFSIIVSAVESLNEQAMIQSIIEALFFAIIAYSIGWSFDRSRYFRRKSELNEERYRDIIECSPEPILVYRNDRIVFVNDQLESLVKLTSNQIIGKSIFDFVLPEYHEMIRERIKKANEGHKNIERVELKIRVGQNNILDIGASSIPIIYENEPSIEVFLKDITERKKLEEKSRKNEDLYKFITENSTDIISYINPDGIYQYMSPSCHQILGYEQHEIMNKSLFYFSHPDETEEMTRLFPEAAHFDFGSLPHRFMKKDGSYIWLETNARTIRNDKKVLEGIVAVSRDITQRIERERKLIETNERLKYLSNYDGLTDIPNRRYFKQMLKKEWNRTMRQKLPLSLLMIDIDSFKKFNDHYGHQAGDICIKKIANAMKEVLKRPGDSVARYGGEEFVVILPETDSKGASHVSESLLSNVRNLKLPNEVSDVSNYVTISIGCATVTPTEHHKAEDLIGLADKELYSAKKEGKNQVRSTILH